MLFRSRKGLAALCHRDDPGTVAHQWLRGTLHREAFDPFVVSILEVVQKLSTFGKELGAHECPFCAVNVRLMNRDADKNWLDNVTDAMLLHALANGLRVGG